MIGLICYKITLSGNKKSECSDEVREYLDREIVGWRDEVNSRKGMNRAVQMQKAREIVQRYRERGNVIPRKLADRSTPEKEQEYKDAQKLTKWKQTLKGNGNSKYNCPDEIRDYLDENMPHWRDEVREKNCYPMQFARDIVRRYHERGGVLPRQKSDYRKTYSGKLSPTSKAASEECQQEYKDARKLHKWRQTLKGNGNGHNCPDEIRDYLDRELVNWREGAKGKPSTKPITSSHSNVSTVDNGKKKRSMFLVTKQNIIGNGGISAAYEELRSETAIVQNNHCASKSNHGRIEKDYVSYEGEVGSSSDGDTKSEAYGSEEGKTSSSDGCSSTCSDTGKNSSTGSSTDSDRCSPSTGSDDMTANSDPESYVEQSSSNGRKRHREKTVIGRGRSDMPQAKHYKLTSLSSL